MVWELATLQREYEEAVECGRNEEAERLLKQLNEAIAEIKRKEADRESEKLDRLTEAIAQRFGLSWTAASKQPQDATSATTQPVSTRSLPS